MALHLSQIILYVEKDTLKEDVWSFRTNNLQKDPEIWFTYLDFDNINQDKLSVSETFQVIKQSTKNQFENIMEKLICPREEAIILTDNPGIIEEAVLMDIACAAIIDSDGIEGGQSFPYARYCLQNLSELSLDEVVKIWQRHRNIPWEIASTIRLTLREQTLSDLEDLYDMYSNPSTTLFMEDLFEDRKEEEEYLKEYIRHQYGFFEYGLWTIIEKCSGNYVGRAGLSNREGYEEAEVGYVIKSEYRNKGMGKEALEAILTYAKDNLGMKSLIAFSRPENTVSIKLLSSLDFIYCQDVEIDGKKHNLYRIIL